MSLGPVLRLAFALLLLLPVVTAPSGHPEGPGAIVLEDADVEGGDGADAELGRHAPGPAAFLEPGLASAPAWRMRGPAPDRRASGSGPRSPPWVRIRA